MEIRSNYSYRLGEYKQEKQKYEQEYQKYLQDKLEQENRVKDQLSKQSLARFRAIEVANWKANRKKPAIGQCENDIPKKGVSESFFEKRLRASFNTVLTNQRIESSNNNAYYYPDFLIIEDGLFIDIEIDEPYIGDTKEPIHYLREDNLSVDEDRDNWLKSEGFEIIRFTEEQVLLETNACITLLKNFLAEVKNGRNTRQYNNVQVHKRWTKEDAVEYAEQNYRDTYLTKVFPNTQSLLRNERLASDVEENDDTDYEDFNYR